MNALWTKLKGLKTIMVAFTIAAFGVLDVVNWADVIPDGKWQGAQLVLVGLLMAWLRLITTGPVGSKE